MSQSLIFLPISWFPFISFFFYYSFVVCGLHDAGYEPYPEELLLYLLFFYVDAWKLFFLCLFLPCSFSFLVLDIITYRYCSTSAIIISCRCVHTTTARHTADTKYMQGMNEWMSQSTAIWCNNNNLSSLLLSLTSSICLYGLWWVGFVGMWVLHQVYWGVYYYSLFFCRTNNSLSDKIVYVLLCRHVRTPLFASSYPPLFFLPFVVLGKARV